MLRTLLDGCLSNLNTFSVFPQNCESSCSCYYHDQYMANVYNCSKNSSVVSTSNDLPESGPIDTNWMCMKKAGLLSLLSVPYYLNKLRYLDVSYNFISNISNVFIEDMKRTSIKWLDLSHNQLTSVSKQFMDISTLRGIFLEENPLQCNCELVHICHWMSTISIIPGDDPIPNQFLSRRGRLDNLTCIPNQKNHLNWELDLDRNKVLQDETKCFTKKKTDTKSYDKGSKVHVERWMIGLPLGISSFIIAFVFIMFIHKRIGPLKWFLYRHTGMTFIQQEIEEDREGMIFDAFISYW